MPTSWNIQERNYKSDHKFFGKDKGVASSEFYDAWEDLSITSRADIGICKFHGSDL